MATKTQTITTKYGGIEITVGADGYWRFTLDGEEEQRGSKAEAIDRIDKWQKAQEAQKRQRVNLPCIAADTGKRVVITGVHAGSGKLLPSDATGKLIADTPEAAAAYEVFVKARDEYDRAQKAIAKFGFRSRYRRSRMNADEHAEAIRQICADYEEAKQGRNPDPYW